MNYATKVLRALLFGLSLITIITTTQAQTNVWTGPAVGNWDDPANWSLGVVPSSTPFDPLANSVLIDANTGQNSSVLLEGTRSIGTLLIDAGDTLTIANASLGVGLLLNSGNIQLVGQGQNPNRSSLRIADTLINAPGGLLSLDNGSIASQDRNHLFWNQSRTEGDGDLSNLFIQNDALVDANVSGKQLRLFVDSTNEFRTLRNSGTMRASGGGILFFSNWQSGGILNQDVSGPGTIEAQGDSTVLFVDTTVIGGRIASSAEGGVEEGQIHFLGQISLEGVELDANAALTGSLNSGLRLIDSNFANKKTLSLAGESLQILGKNTLSGGGVLKLSGNARVQGIGGDFSKFVNLDNTVLVPQESMAFFGREMLVENHGIFEANGQDAFLVLRLNGPFFLAPGSESWTNTGVIRAVNRGKVFFGSTEESVFENTGGVLEVDENSSLQFDHTRIRGGIVRGPTAGSTFPPPFLGEATLEDVRLEGTVSWQQGLTLVGNIENVGTLKSDEGIGIFLGSEEVIFTGGGELFLERVRSNDDSLGTRKLINVDNTLRVNGGNSSFEEVDFVNRGTVEASGPDLYAQLGVDNSTNMPRLNNSGLIRAIDGASLKIDMGYSTFLNYELDEFGNVLPGKIQAGADSEVILNSVSGGILQATEGGIIRIQSGGSLNSINTHSEMHLLGRIEAEDVSLAGTIRNDGQLAVSFASYNFGAGSPPLRLIGNGELQLSPGTLDISNNSSFLNGPDHAIVGFGSVITGTSFFTNEGRIEASGNNFLTIFHTAPAFLFQQRGELISSGNGTLDINGVTNWGNDGLIESRDTAQIIINFGGFLANRGTVRVASGSETIFFGDLSNSNHQFVNAIGAEIVVDGRLFVRNSDFVNEFGATVEGVGQINLVPQPLEDSRFINHGTLAPGNSVGRLTIFGEFEQSAIGKLEIELGGTSPEEYDSLAAWSADLAGLLEVSFVDLDAGEFTPELGDTFEIIELTSDPVTGFLAGEFDTFQLPTLASDWVWGIQYNSTSVVLEILAPLLADFDNDGDVDGRDLLLIQSNDPSLISQWQTEYGSRVVESLASSRTVPEPSTAILVMGAFVAWVTVLQKGKRRPATG